MINKVRNLQETYLKVVPAALGSTKHINTVPTNAGKSRSCFIMRSCVFKYTHDKLNDYASNSQIERGGRGAAASHNSLFRSRKNAQTFLSIIISHKNVSPFSGVSLDHLLPPSSNIRLHAQMFERFADLCNMPQT